MLRRERVHPELISVFHADNNSPKVRYDCIRGAVNSTANERTHMRRGHFSVFQKVY